MVVLSETRLTEARQRQYGKLLADVGFVAVWGAPRARKRFNSIAPGGVAVIARQELGAHLVPLDSDCAQHYEAGRMVHAAVGLGKATCLHIVGVYGHPNASTDREQRRKNEKLLEDGCKTISGLGPNLRSWLETSMCSRASPLSCRPTWPRACSQTAHVSRQLSRVRRSQT